MSTQVATFAQNSGPVVTERRQADTDDQLIEIWLHGRGDHTQRAYRADVNEFRAFVAMPLVRVILSDLQRFADNLEARALSAGSRARKLSTIKSLMTFGVRVGYLKLNPGAGLRLPARRNDLAERIMTEEAALKMIALEKLPRNRAILRLLYGSGVRVSELVGLRWRDLLAREVGGQVTVLGKGEKTRAILISPKTYSALAALPQGEPNDPIFRSRKKGGALDASQVLRIVQAAATRAGIAGHVSPHWLRHAHASHALDRGAPIHLVQATLGHASVATTGRYTHARPTESSSRYLSV